MNPATLAKSLAPHGLVSLGIADATTIDPCPPGVSAVVLLGLASDGWERFEASPEAGDTIAEPLDRWSERVIGDLAQDLGAQAYFPFGGPPYHPFLRWAAATGEVWPSPLGMSIHAEHGLWVSFRGALGFAGFDRPKRAAQQRPCDKCSDQPCLTACPVSAFGEAGYDVPRCVSHISSEEGGECIARGCLARRACPIGREWTPPPSRASFHMTAFRRARTGG